MKLLFGFFLAASLLIISCATESYENETGISVPDGFKVEKLITPSASEMGSWVSLTHIKGNRFAASDQYGKIYWLDVPSIGGQEEINVEELEVDLGKAQGLLWAYNSLYVMVNDQQTENSGLYRISDSNNDGTLDDVSFLKHLNGWGEHGPHAVIKGPDGLIYTISGNHTELPESYTSRAPSIWDQDRLFESIKDPNGHATKIKAPGGWIARTDSVGGFWEVYSSGYRNAYDIAFNEHGELFTFDSDMEWDLGLPWYRPVRVCHVTSGSQYGWRTGSGKWPVYYPDNLPGVIDVGQGSPTGVVSAMKSNFPEPLNTGLFICDWSFGTMYHASLEQDGASYSGSFTEFLSGVPLPLTDVTFGDDGAMYFTTGGRRLSSGFYRVWYTKDVSEATTVGLNDKMQLRRNLEQYHDPVNTPDPELIWDNLGNSERTIRFASRIAMEKQGVEKWENYFDKESNPNRLIESGIATARTGSISSKETVYSRLGQIVVENLSDEEKLGLIRALGLLKIRQPTLKISTIEAQWENEFPSNNPYINEELASLFVNSNNSQWFNKLYNIWQNAEENERSIMISDEVASRHEGYGEAIINAKKRTPFAHKIALMDAMSKYETGWTKDKRADYFQGFNGLWDREGGNSYRGFILSILERALASLPSNEKRYYKEISGAQLGEYGRTVLADLPVPEGPGQNWSVDQVVAIMSDADLTADYQNGQKMYEAVLCKACHTMQGQGSNLGPDLTQLGSRFTVRDIAVTMIDPNLEISDQYMVSNYFFENGSQLRGKTIKIENDTAHIMINPLTPDNLRKIPVIDIMKEEKSNQSFMFPALLNRLNEQEVFDLMTFLLAGGEEGDELYGG